MVSAPTSSTYLSDRFLSEAAMKLRTASAEVAWSLYAA